MSKLSLKITLGVALIILCCNVESASVKKEHGEQHQESHHHLSDDLVRKFKVQEYCYEYFDAPWGNFTSPEYPDVYPANISCSWDIYAVDGLTISLQFTEFQAKCSNGEIFYVYTSTSEFNQYCGTNTIPIITDAGSTDEYYSTPYITASLYTSNEGSPGSLFAAEYTTACTNRSIEIDSKYIKGTGRSPGYSGGYYYPDNMNCSWSLQRSSSIPDIRLAILSFNIERDYDFVRIMEDGQQVEVLTGNLDFTGSAPYVRISRANNLLIQFTSDYTVGEAGFVFAYAPGLPYNRTSQGKSVGKYPPPDPVPSQEKAKILTENPDAKVVTIDLTKNEVIGKNIDSKTVVDEKLVRIGAPYGFISSPFHPDDYGNYDDVIYKLTTYSYQQIAIGFLRFEVESDFDYVIIQEAGQPDVSFTGYDLPREVIYSQGNEIFIRFTSDGSVRHSGFLLAYASL